MQRLQLTFYAYETDNGRYIWIYTYTCKYIYICTMCIYRKSTHTHAKKLCGLFFLFNPWKIYFSFCPFLLKILFKQKQESGFSSTPFCKRRRKHICKSAKSLPAKFHPTVNFYCWLHYKIQKGNWGCITVGYNGKLRFTQSLCHHYWADITYVNLSMNISGFSVTHALRSSSRMLLLYKIKCF